MRGRDLEGGGEREVGEINEGESFARIYNQLFKNLLHYITFYLLNKDVSIVHPNSGTLIINLWKTDNSLEEAENNN